MRTNRRTMKVYNAARTRILTECSANCSSIGAAKQAGVSACFMALVSGEWAWVEKC